MIEEKKVRSFSDYSLRRRSDITKKGRDTAEILVSDDALDDIELLEDGGHERTLILNAVPISRRAQLIAQGAKLIRCMCCHQIKPLVGADESEEGWVCEDCIPDLRNLFDVKRQMSDGLHR